MITFKQPEDLDKPPATDPAYATVKEIISPYIDDPNYRPSDDGYLAILDPGDVDRVLSDLDLPWRLSEVPFEAVTLTDGWYETSWVPTNQFVLTILVSNDDWLPDDVRRHLESHLDP